MTLMDIPEVRYATSSGDVRIAYEVVGRGEVDVVFALGLIPNLEMSREVSFLRRWLERLTSFARVVHYDRRGVGVSDRDLSMGSPEEQMDDIRAVMDAAGLERAALVTSIDGGPIALTFAATYPDRVQSLVLYESWARVAWKADYPIGLKDLERGLSGHARTHWGDGTTVQQVIGDSWDPAATRRLLAKLERTIASPKFVYKHFELAQKVDVRAALPSVQAPALVLARRDLARYLPLSEWLADSLQVPLVSVAGQWLHSWRDDYEDAVLDLIQDFLVHEPGKVTMSQRVLQTLIFTDIVGSTKRAMSLGDAEWRNLLARHDALVRSQIARYHGREIKHTGDGLLASFDGPARAVRCAHSIQETLSTIGIDVRAGIHTGECEVRGDDVAGIAVHIAARVCALAGAGEVLATSTVRDLVVGSGLEFEDRGTRTLKGIDTPWPIVAALSET